MAEKGDPKMTIVVGVDGSAESNKALRWAIEEARLRNTTVRAIYAWEYPPVLGGGDPFLGGPAERPLLIDPQELRVLAEARLAVAVAEATSDPDVVKQEAVQGHPAESLLEAAKGAELLVVGSRGHGGFAGLLLGSVSYACAQHAGCPVVIIHG
jgi:nucleotide-binding universal stress UspA family protein